MNRYNWISKTFGGLISGVIFPTKVECAQTELPETLPRHLSAKARIDNARIYLSAVNLYTFSKFGKEFWDPEVGADSYPIQATVFVRLNLTF